MGRDKLKSVDGEMLSLLRYNSLEEAGKEMVCMEAESKISEYKSEVKKFEEKNTRI